MAKGSEATMQYLANVKREGKAKTEAIKVASKKALKRLSVYAFFFLVASGLGTFGFIKANKWLDENQIVVKLPVEVFYRTNAPVTIVKRVVAVTVSSEQAGINEAVKESENPDIAKIICDKWSAVDCKVAIAVYTSESGLNPLAINWDSKDFGVAQINLPTWEDAVKEKFGYTRADLLTADKNLEVAYWIWDRADGKEGDGKGNFNGWVAFTTEAYLSKL